MKLSVVVSAYNEQKNIEECLRSVGDLAQEIVVIDNLSSDSTASIARKFTKKVFEQKNDPKKIDLQKNFGFSRATGDWILSLDADERVTPELAREIREKIQGSPASPSEAGQAKPEAQSSGDTGYWIPRKNIIFGKWIKSDMWYPDYQLKLFRRGKGGFSKSSVHRALQVEGATEKLENPLIHYNYTSVSQFISKLNNYTDIETENLLEGGYEFNFLDAIKFPVDDFVKTFFLQKGYRDGLHGLVLSLLQAFYMEVVFAKLWEARKFEEKTGGDFLAEVKSELKNSANKVKYWLVSALINESNNPVKKTVFRVARKITSATLRNK